MKNRQLQFNDLPPELKQLVFYHLGPKDLKRLTGVSKTLYNEANNPQAWMQKFILHFPHHFKAYEKKDPKTVNWYQAFVRADMNNYTGLHPDSRNLFRWAKEGDILSLRKALKYFHLDERDKKDISLLEWFQKGHPELRQFVYQFICQEEYQRWFSLDVTKTDIKGRTLLHHALFLSEPIKTIASLIDKKADVNAACWIDDDQVRPLHIATQQGRLDIVNLLLEKKVDVDAPTSGGVTALHFAVLGSHFEIASILIANKANINATTAFYKATPLSVAVQTGCTDILKLLITQGANINLRRLNGATALYLAAEKGRLDMVQLLFANHADIELACSSTTPLIAAAKKGHLDVVNFLLAKQANIHAACRREGGTALALAAKNGHLEVVCVLLEKGADVNAINPMEPNSATALHFAAENGHQEMIKVLLANKADINKRNAVDMTPLHVAVKHCRLDVIKLLLAYQADVEAVSMSGLTVLHIAAQEGHLEIVNLLLTHAANRHAIQMGGMTALHFAAQSGHYSVVNALLINDNTGIDSPCKDGATALYIAAKKGHSNVVDVLLANGADVHRPCVGGATALFIAVCFGHFDIVQLLLTYYANANFVCMSGNTTPLFMAAGHGRINIVRALLEKKADVNAIRSDGTTALYIAAKKNYLETVKLLLAYGADVNIACSDGTTPFLIAKQKGHVNIMNAIKRHSDEQVFFKYEEKTNARDNADYKKHEFFGYQFDLSLFGACSAEEKKAALAAYKKVYFNGEKVDLTPHKKALGEGELGSLVNSLSRK